MSRLGVQVTSLGPAKSLENVSFQGFFATFKSKTRGAQMCKNSKSAQKSAQLRKSRVKVIDTSEMKGCVSMANIRENKKNSKIISFRFIVCLERDVRGKQIRKYTT